MITTLASTPKHDNILFTISVRAIILAYALNDLSCGFLLAVYLILVQSWIIFFYHI